MYNSLMSATERRRQDSHDESVTGDDPPACERSRARAPERTPVVAIVGAGFAGTLVAANLLELARPPLRIVLIERSGRFGPGVAYGTSEASHLLNVPAARMSAYERRPDHFAEWASARLGRDVSADYLPRALYGEYLEALLRDARAAAAPGVHLELRRGTVAAIERSDLGLHVRLAGTSSMRCDLAVLATGALAAAPPAGIEPQEGVYASPWHADSLLGGGAHGTTLLVGTGLTAVDTALSIGSRGGRVLMVSPSGRMPHPHLPGLRPPAPAPQVPSGQVTLAALEGRLLRHTEAMRAAGYDWRDVVDGIKPVASELWRSIDLDGRRRFIRERRSAWEVCRHRMAPEVHARMRELIAQGRISVRAGRVTATERRPAGLQAELVLAGERSPRRIDVESVVACVGLGLDVNRSGSTLLASLLRAGLATPDALMAGLRADSSGALHGSGGRLFTLGSLRRGELWETTSVGTIRGQAEAVADALLARLQTAESGRAAAARQTEPPAWESARRAPKLGRRHVEAHL